MQKATMTVCSRCRNCIEAKHS